MFYIDFEVNITGENQMSIINEICFYIMVLMSLAVLPLSSGWFTGLVAFNNDKSFSRWFAAGLFFLPAILLSIRIKK